MSYKDADFYTTPKDFDSWPEEKKLQWIFARKLAEEDEKSLPEMYCTKCKIPLKYVELHLQRDHPSELNRSFIITKEEHIARQQLPGSKFFPKGGILWFWGIDTAKEIDFNTTIINGLASKKTDKWIPKLRDIYRLPKKTDYLDNLNFHFKIIAQKYPPTLVAVDASNNPTYVSILEKKLGKHRVLPIPFTNKSKLDMKLIGKHYINSGYEWPDVDKLEREKRISPEKAFLVRELKKEMLQEIMTQTKNDSLAFDHPPGKHNDLAHGGELSLKACMEYQKNRIGESFLSTHPAHGASYPTLADEISKKEKSKQQIIAMLQKRGLNPDRVTVEMQD